MKVLLITPTSSQIIGFRSKFIENLKNEGHIVYAVAFDAENREEIEKRGIVFYSINDSNRGINPIKIISLKKRYGAVIKEVCPDVVMTFMLKPNIYGVIAAKRAGIKKIYCMVEGTGDVFINVGIKWHLIRSYVCHMYKKALKASNKVLFLNEDDKAEFIRRKLVKHSKCIIIHGIGVDLKEFSFKPVKKRNVFLMVARMLKTKGVYEFFKAAKLVKHKYPDAVFNYLGGEGTVKLTDVREYIDEGSVNYLGVTKDVRPYYEDCTVFVLPSYREGFSVSIMEAESTGRAVITTDTNGCRDAIREGYNGYLVEKNNVEDLASKIIWCIEHPAETERMGENARKFAEENFDSEVNNGKLLDIIRE